MKTRRWVMASTTGFALLLEVWYWYVYYLPSHFTNAGEAFFKGAGHILHENLPFGLILLVAQPLLSWALLTLLIGLFMPRHLRLIGEKLVVVLWLAYLTGWMLYTHSKGTETQLGQFTNGLRVLEFLLVALSRGTGLLLAFLALRWLEPSPKHS